MRKLIISIIIALVPVAAYATCTTSTYTYKGKMVMCTTCCINGHCTTNCI